MAWRRERRKGSTADRLPFGVTKGQDGVPVPAAKPYPFELAAAGRSALQSGSARSGSLQVPATLAV